MFFDPLYLLLIAPAFLLSLFATFLTRSRFRRYGEVPLARGLRGVDVAQYLLQRAGIAGVRIEEYQGFLSDHYDPTSRTLRLSRDVYWGTSISATAVAAHETGHALQHASAYWPLGFRNKIVPLASIGSSFSYVIIIVGLLLHTAVMAYAGVALFTAVVVFQLITLPVEFDASARAKRMLFESGLVVREEREGVARVLSAAALTYVAAAASAILTLVYFLVRTGLLGGGARHAR